MNEELEKLVEYALADGVVTDQERLVLQKKAAALGVDLDEFNMILEAKIHMTNQKQKQAAPKPSSSKHGGMRKCPACGSAVDGMASQCSECGYTFTDVEAVKSAEKLFKVLQDINVRKSQELSAHAEQKSLRLKELTESQNSGGAMKQLLSSKEAKAREREAIIEEHNKEANRIEKKYQDETINVVKCFPVPNTKEDLLELLSMASSNAYDNDGVVGLLEEAWLQKTDQLYQKILIVCASDKDAVSRSTSLITSLIKRLPKQYKKFTIIPQNLMTAVHEELEAEKKELSAIRKQNAIKALKSWKGILAIAGLVLGIILLVCNVELGAFFLIAGIVGAWLLIKDLKKVFSYNGLYS